MALPPEKITELKQIIHTQLCQMDIQSQIRDVLSETVGKTSQKNGGITEEDMMGLLREKGVVEDIMKQLQFQTTRQDMPLPTPRGNRPATRHIDKDDKLLSALPIKKANVDPTRRYLYLQILGGKAFLEHLSENEAFPGQPSATLTLHVLFRGQRYRSRSVPCACEPTIQEGFLLELHKEAAGDAARMADSTTLLSLCDSVHLSLVKTEPSGDTTLVSSHHLEWRTVLAAPSSRCSVTLELMGVGTENKVPVGILETRLEVIPKLSDALTEDVISAQVSLEKSRHAEKERLFLVYAKQWWKEFLQIRSSHKDRLVKIFAQDENAVNRPVCLYVRPLRAGRLLDTPRQAARFVSLIGYEKALSVGGGEKPEIWCSMHGFLTRNKGDSEDHAVLLCSLLLGFGLDAYVCVGTKNRGAAHAWVLTLGNEGTATFWESLTGHRYIHQAINPDNPPADPMPKSTHPYRTIGCIFNHERFYANCQPTDAVDTCQFVLHNDSRWKPMSEDAIRSVTFSSGGGITTGWAGIPPLIAPTLDSALVSNDLEQELRSLVVQHRRDQGLGTVWDDHLSYLLTPALASYETERITGVTSGNEEFQQAIRRAVPDGHTFKGYPIQFVHRNGRRAFTACLKSPVCEEIINCRGDHIRLAVRVRVFTYPETAAATWIMFACKYKSVV